MGARSSNEFQRLEYRHPQIPFTCVRSSNELQILDYMAGCQDSSPNNGWTTYPTPQTTGLILGVRPASQRGRYKATPSLIGLVQTQNQPWSTFYSLQVDLLQFRGQVTLVHPHGGTLSRSYHLHHCHRLCANSGIRESDLGKPNHHLQEHHILNKFWHWLSLRGLTLYLHTHNISEADTSRAPSQYKDRLIYVWRFPC